MQGRLNRAIPTRVVGRDLRGVHEGHPSELSHIDVVKGRPVDEGERRAGEALVRGVPELLEGEPAGHPQRGAQRVAAIQDEDDELAAAAHRLDAPARQARGQQLHRLGLGEAHPIGRERRDRPAGHELRELPRDGLDFG